MPDMHAPHCLRAGATHIFLLHLVEEICAMTRLLTLLWQVLAPAHGALAQTEAVYALTDEELARRGLKRRDAAHQILTNGDWS